MCSYFLSLSQRNGPRHHRPLPNRGNSHQQVTLSVILSDPYTFMHSFTDYWPNPYQELPISSPVPDTDAETEATSWKPVASPTEKAQAFSSIQSLPHSVPLVGTLSDPGVFVLGSL